MRGLGIFSALPGDDRDLHRADRRQRQMCVRDSFKPRCVGGEMAPKRRPAGAKATAQPHPLVTYAVANGVALELSLIHISEPTRQARNSYAGLRLNNIN